MKTLLLTVSYSGNDKFWSDSYLKNSKIKQLQGESIHDTVKRAVEEADGCELSYKGKPISDMFRDLKGGGSKQVGYVYRGKIEIWDRHNDIRGAIARFDVWVEIQAVSDLVLEPVENL